MFDLIEKNRLIARVRQVPEFGVLLTFQLAVFAPIFPLEDRCRLSSTMSLNILSFLPIYHRVGPGKKIFRTT